MNYSWHFPLSSSTQCSNPINGVTLNPLRYDRTPHGSSGGEGAIVGGGGSPLGFGTDLGGSIRLPAAMCGLVGFKPTTGRLRLVLHRFFSFFSCLFLHNFIYISYLVFEICPEQGLQSQVSFLLVICQVFTQLLFCWSTWFGDFLFFPKSSKSVKEGNLYWLGRFIKCWSWSIDHPLISCYWRYLCDFTNSNLSAFHDTHIILSRACLGSHLPWCSLLPIRHGGYFQL